MRTKATELPQRIINAMRPEDRADLGIRTAEENIVHAENAAEDIIQQKVEGYLQYLGFEPRTPKAIKAGRPRSGWYIHLHRCKENPLLLDLLILHNSGLYFEQELKKKSGTWSSEPQRLLVEYGGNVAYSAEQAVGNINNWLIENGLRD